MNGIGRAREIVKQFDLRGEPVVSAFAARGNINLDTFLVTADGSEYIFQRLNTDVFKMPDRVMRSMMRWIESKRSYLNRHPDLNWKLIQLVPTLSGHLWHETSDGQYWRLMHRITGCASFKSLDALPSRRAQLDIAYQMGRGLALSIQMTSEMDPSWILPSLPGYRDTELYLNQHRSVLDGAPQKLPEDEELLHSTSQLFHRHVDEAEFNCRLSKPGVREMLNAIDENADYSLTLQRGVASQRIRRTVIHGDTKLENFLFDERSMESRSLIDLDTVMSYTWLNDWGDMIRSLVNVAGEKAENLDDVRVDRDVYAAATEGFNNHAPDVPEAERALMPDAVRILAFEQGLRFLTDYLRGDNYYQLGSLDSPDLNLQRARVQFQLFAELKRP